MLINETQISSLSLKLRIILLLWPTDVWVKTTKRQTDAQQERGSKDPGRVSFRTSWPASTFALSSLTLVNSGTTFFHLYFFLPTLQLLQEEGVRTSLPKLINLSAIPLNALYGSEKRLCFHYCVLFFAASLFPLPCKKSSVSMAWRADLPYLDF